MVNMMKLMKQAASVQQDMQKLQEDLAEQTVEFSSGGGVVTAVARGDMTLERVTIEPKVVDPTDVEMPAENDDAAAKMMAARLIESRVTVPAVFTPGEIPEKVVIKNWRKEE